MKALLVSDLHLRPAHIEQASLVLEKIKEKLRELNPEYLIIGGDTFHTKNIVYASVLTLFESFIDDVSRRHKVVCLVGNHDWAIPYEVHSLQTIKRNDFVIVEKTFKINDSVGFIGYCREKDRFDTLMKDLRGCKIIFGHFDLNGFDLGSGWEETDAFCGGERLTEFKKVFSGHFHKPQEKTFGETEIIYVGSAYTTDFSESDQEKRFILVDLESGNWEPIPTNMVFHRTLKITTSDQIPNIDENQINDGINFRVIISGTKEEINKVKIPNGYKAKVVFDIIQKDHNRADINAHDSVSSILSKYVSHELTRAKRDLDREELLKVGSSILTKVGMSIK